MLVALVLAAAATPSAEAEALGKRLAASGTLASIAPALIEKDGADLAAEDSTLTEAERARVMVIARERGRAGIERITAALGHAYATRLTLADLRTLVAAAESPAARHKRAADAPALAEAVGKAGQVDVKKEVAAQLCRETGKLYGR